MERLPGRHVRPLQHIPPCLHSRIVLAEVGKADSPEGGGGLAVAAQDPSLLFSLPSLRAAASSSQGLSRPGRGHSALSVSPWRPPLWRWQCFGGLVLGVSSEQLGLPHRHTRGLVLGAAAGACAPGTVPPWCSGPSWGPGPRAAPTQSWPESVDPGAQAEACVGWREHQPPSHPVAFGCMSLGPGKRGFQPGGSRGSLSAAPGGCTEAGLGVGPWLWD